MAIFSGGFENSSTSELPGALISLVSPKQLVASSSELAHECNTSVLEEHLGSISLALEGVNVSTEQEPSLAVFPGAMPLAAVTVGRTRRTCQCWMSKRWLWRGSCSSEDSSRGSVGWWQRPSDTRSPQALGCACSWQGQCAPSSWLRDVLWLCGLLAGRGHLGDVGPPK